MLLLIDVMYNKYIAFFENLKNNNFTVEKPQENLTCEDSDVDPIGIIIDYFAKIQNR